MDSYLRGLEEKAAGYAFKIILSEAGHDPELTKVLRRFLLGLDFGPEARETIVQTASDAILHGILPRSGEGAARGTTSRTTRKER